MISSMTNIKTMRSGNSSNILEGNSDGFTVRILYGPLEGTLGVSYYQELPLISLSSRF